MSYDVAAYKGGNLGRSRLSQYQKTELMILRISDLDKVSELCRQHQVHHFLPKQWKKQFPEGGKRYLSYNVVIE